MASELASLSTASTVADVLLYLRQETGVCTALLTLPLDTHEQVIALSGRRFGDFSDDSLPLRYSICSYVSEMKHPLVVDNAFTHPLLKHHPAVDELGVGAYLGVPVLADRADGSCGVLCLRNYNPRPWTDADLSMMKDAAARILEIAPRVLDL